METIDLIGTRGVRLRCRVATRHGQRARGLIGMDRLASGWALLIPNATSVHTFGMRFPILVARLDGSLRMVDLRLVPPKRLVLPMRSARHVLEGSVGLDLRVGDVLSPVSGEQGLDDREDDGRGGRERHHEDRPQPAEPGG